MKENKNLHRLNTSLHEKNHFLSLKQAEFEELINAEQTKNEELQNKLDDLEYELTKSRMRNGKLETVLVDTQVNIWTKSALLNETKHKWCSVCTVAETKYSTPYYINTMKRGLL